MVMMQGTLWKWTNYLSGWQPRWFILDYGVLAYYRSQDEVHLGSRGSVKMSCCEIHVHPTDPVRLDLKVPPENHMYLRASTAGERQQWLVALGTSKACLIDANYQEQKQQMDSVNFLKEKMSELNMCRNIMMQQVNHLKSLCSKKDEQNQERNEAATLLSATCDTFLSNLSDMMEIVEDSLSTVSSSPVSTPIRVNKPMLIFRKQHNRERGNTPPSSPSSFTDSLVESEKGFKDSLTSEAPSHTPTRPHPPETLFPPPAKRAIQLKPPVSSELLKMRERDEQRSEAIQPPSIISSPSATSQSTNNDKSRLYTLSQQSLESPSSEETPKIEACSFFGSASVKFEDIIIGADGSIPTKPFLDAVSCITPFFDVLGSTTFAPVKMDISGNVKKLRTKYISDERAFVYLQNMVFQEMKSNTCTAKNSSTDALLWLKRALEFMQIFLAEVVKGEKNLAVAASTAYEKSLRRYHGWVVRGVFALAVKAVPYRKDFFTVLGTTNKGVSSESEVLKEMGPSTTALGKTVNILNQFYKRHKLDSDSTV